MQLLTAHIVKTLRKHPLGSQDGKGFNAKIIVKFFGGSRYTFYVTEGSPCGNDWEFFGYCVSALGPDCDEWGYTMLSQLTSMRFPPFRLPIERDLYFPILEKTVEEVLPKSR